MLSASVWYQYMSEQLSEVFNYFSKPVLSEESVTNVEDEVDTTPCLGTLKELYKPGNILVVSLDKYSQLSKEDRDWISVNVDAFNNMIFFPGKSLVNIAIIR